MSYFLTSASQVDYKVKADTLSPDDLILVKLEGVERLSEPFEFQVTFQSASNSLALETLIGKSVSIKAKYSEGERYFSGIFGRLTQGITAPDASKVEITYYHAVIYPTLWKLKFGQDCRIFQHKSALEIIKAVLGENGVALQDKTQGSGTGERAYCVQYNESHFNFVSRLMEQEGIYYFFEHNDGSHTMVLIDDVGSHKKCPHAAKVEMNMSDQQTFVLNRVLEAHYGAQLVTSSFEHVDFDYKKPSTKLHSKAPGGGQARFGNVYEYPGDFLVSGDGENFANIHISEVEALKVSLNGTSTVPFFSPGYKFTLAKHHRDDVNQGYVLYEIHHHLLVEPSTAQDHHSSYTNTFVAFPDSVSFRPVRKTPRPRIHSTQTAIVTGKAGEEIWTDKYGRIKVKFHWDQKGPSDEKSSCWIRVAQGWTGTGWGILFTPRIGMEVVVSFICGDPDRPLVTGMVYNADHMPPYLPAEPTKSTILTNSTKHGGGFNELRFEDKKGQEEIWVHAQKDMNIEVIHDRTAVIDKGDDSLDIKKGSRTTTIKKNYTKTIKDGNETIQVKKGNYTRKVKGNYMLTVGGNMVVKVDGNIIIKSGANTLMEAGANTVIKSGASGVVQASALQVVKGSPVKIN